ncbi:hypothetical protein J6590_073386 [Homalodisca vitripennis]|nr:hypothetical protein J6590_073386 [Homalodisca vitripennis]
MEVRVCVSLVWLLVGRPHRPLFFEDQEGRDSKWRPIPWSVIMEFLQPHLDLMGIDNLWTPVHDTIVLLREFFQEHVISRNSDHQCDV